MMVSNDKIAKILFLLNLHALLVKRNDGVCTKNAVFCYLCVSEHKKLSRNFNRCRMSGLLSGLTSKDSGLKLNDLKCNVYSGVGIYRGRMAT